MKSIKIKPDKVHQTLKKHILVDGFHLVLDLDKSRGVHLWDAKDKRMVFDFFSFFATQPVGMNHPKTLTKEYKNRIGHVALYNPTNSDVYTTHYAEFLATFERVGIPSYLPHAFFIAGGALGIENAIKAAFDWKVRKNFAKGYKEEKGTQVIHFRQAFHGRTGYTLSMTNTDPTKTNYFPKFKWPRIENPKLSFPLTESIIENVKKAEQLALDQIHLAIRDNKDDIAALLIEPIQAEGGDNHFRKEFLQALRTICDEHEIFFIIDEVQAGVGITGTFWAHQGFDVKPDAIGFGKKAQVCGCLVGPRIDEVKDNVFQISSRINSTWGGNLVDMVRFQRYLEIIEEDKLVANAAKNGAYLLMKLNELQEHFKGKVTNARGRGLMCAFDLPDGPTRNAFRENSYKIGVMILGCGERSVRFRPVLDISKKDIDEGIGLIQKALQTTLK